MAALCLSRSEVAELCRTPQRVRQCAFLRSNGIRHYVDSRGWPVVLRSAVEDREQDPGTATTWKPNKAA